jgi:catechol 2,3-dioxygenase-like lactoylglutathione lyase family enzyme
MAELAQYAFHPTLHVRSIEGAEDFFRRVFGRESQFLETPHAQHGYNARGQRGYSTFTMIADVLFDSVDPKLHLVEGQQYFATVEQPALQNIGWYVYDVKETYHALKQHGISAITQFGQSTEGDEEPPFDSQSGTTVMFFTPAEKLGIRYQFIKGFPLYLDPRKDPDWTLPPVSDEDPLGIERCSHHTILTRQPDRALKLVVETLGGRVISEGRDDLRRASGPYVHLADAVFHYAIPEASTAADAALDERLPADDYFALTFKVVDLDRVQRHLDATGVGVLARSDDTIVTDPATSLGVPWGFTTRAIPGDPR